MENSEFEDFVSVVRDRSDIYEVVSRYVPLNLKNGRFWACCPFHEEKTPSFSVSPERAIFYCFGCHKGGNVFRFISLMEHITYFEAVKLQAERLGIPIPSRKKNPEEIRIEQEKDSLMKVAFLAQDFYHNCLIKSKSGEAGRKYLAARGISDSVIQEFRLGFAPDSWNALTDNIRSRGFSDKRLVLAGLAVEKKSGGVYDRLRNRIIIPICDISGKAVAFGGRILIEDENQPKYLNTPETEIFRKGKMLFGLDKSSRAITSANTAIIVEGYMDVISLYSAGIKNVVASLGTAFTEDQAKILSRYARRIIFCYDSDEAGQRATIRALPMMKNTGVEVFVLIVPDGKDPDEFVRKHGKDAFEQLLKNVMPVIDYHFQYKLKHINNSTSSGKFQILREMFPLCAELKNSVVRNDYFRKFSSQLVIDENSISEEWNKFLSSTAGKKSFASKNNQLLKNNQSKNSLIVQSGKSIIRTLWNEPELVEYVYALVPREIFSDDHKEIMNFIEKCYIEDIKPNDITANAELNSAANDELSRILGFDDPQDSQVEAFHDSIKNLQRLTLEKRCKQLLVEVSNSSKVDDEESFKEKVISVMELQKNFDEL